MNTQKVALNALVFLFREFLKIELSLNYKPAKTVTRVPVVFSHSEAVAVISNLSGVHQLIVKLLYGSGLRINECLRLRVKDIDFEMNHIIDESNTEYDIEEAYASTSRSILVSSDNHIILTTSSCS